MPIFLAEVDNQCDSARRATYESVGSAAKTSAVPVYADNFDNRFRTHRPQAPAKSVFVRPENKVLASGFPGGAVPPAKAARQEEGESAMFAALSMVIGVFIASAAAAYGSSLCDEHHSAKHLAE